ncbi:MAG: nucleotidyltransferase family protein [Bacteroidetes bacterium]|nr:nucleotidyltransferase family protein [Bacteroidota bacterium]
MECIVLAGGLGTRLQSVIGLYPKCMAEVNSKPFLHYIFDYLEQQQISRVILSLGFKHEVILDWLKTESRKFEIDYVIEETPLGTGGGISLALTKAKEDNVLVLNGDTMFRVDAKAMFKFHAKKNAATTLALKKMQQFERYGVVRMDGRNVITAFEEKKYYDDGLINGGVYIINKEALNKRNLPEKYSFEKDYLEVSVKDGNIYGFESDAYFIDIGIPTDYEQAQQDFKTIQ